MDMNCINQLLKLVKEMLLWFQEWCEAARKGGFPPFSFLPQKDAIELTTAHDGLPRWDDTVIRREHEKMLNRNRVRRWRKRKKEEKEKAKEKSITCNVGNEKCNASVMPGNAVAEENNAPVTPGNATMPNGNETAMTGSQNTITCNAKSVTCNGVMEAALPSVTDAATDAEEAAQPSTTSLFAQDAGTAATKENAAAVTETGNAPVMAGNDFVMDCNDSVMAGNDFAKKEKENEKRKKQRKEINKNKKIIKTNIADAMPNSARAHTREEEGAEREARGKGGLKNETGSCLPFVPGEAKEQEMILTKDLQENFRNIVLAWNRLPVRTKLRGLFPSLVKRLRYILKTYGEDKIYAAMDIIKKCPFLLGKSGNSRGWVIRFDWMLEPEHLEKILDGWYLDEPAGGRSQMFQPGDENIPFSDGFMGTVVY